MKYITPADFEKMMQEIKDDYGGDEEAVHMKMDKLMCEVLKQQGYSSGVEIFENTDTWYS